MSNEEETGYCIGFKMHKGCITILVVLCTFYEKFKTSKFKNKIEIFSAANIFLKLP